MTPTSRGLAVSRKQCCDITGWTGHQFDKAVRDGMPVAERPSGRGTDYVVFMGDVIRWIVEQELKAAGHEPSEVVKLDLNAERARLAKEMGIVSIAPVLKDVALTSGVAGVREHMRVAIADALENVGTKQLAGLQETPSA